MLTKEQLAIRLCDGIPWLNKSQAERIINKMGDIIAGELEQGETVMLFGIGRLKPVTRKPRTARNPQTGAKVEVPECRAVKFTPAKWLKEALKA